MEGEAPAKVSPFLVFTRHVWFMRKKLEKSSFCYSLSVSDETFFNSGFEKFRAKMFGGLGKSP